MGFGKAVFVVLATTVALGCVEPAGHATEALQSTDAGRESSRITYAPEDWRAQCETGKVAEAFPEACEELAHAEGRDAERIAFQLNAKGAEYGLLPQPIAKLRFPHGRYAGWSVQQLAEALDERGDDEPDLDGLVVATNRAFANGLDSGALTEWVETPLCGAEAEIEGPATARCGVLDDVCARGRYLAEGDCCTLELAPAGAWCGDGQVCTPDGRCAESELVEEGRVHGALAWVEALGAGSPHVWSLPPNDEWMRIALVTEAAGQEEPTPVEDPEEWESAWGGHLGSPVAEVSRKAIGSVRARVGHATGAVPVSAIDAAGLATALYLESQVGAVCVVRGRALDSLPPVMSDCSMPGAVAVQCPSDEGELRCEHTDQGTIVRGEDLSLAFALTEEGRKDLRNVWALALPARLCAGFDCARLLALPALPVLGVPGDWPNWPGPIGPPGGFPVEPLFCEIEGGCSGIRVCMRDEDGRSTCVCTPRSERCNGDDDDCDGVVDEGGDAQCNDGIGCTQDYCAGEEGCATGSVRRNGALCSPAYCAKGICNGQIPAGVDPTLPRTAVNANGCQLALDDAFCEQSWDQCACNGQSLCDPTAVRPIEGRAAVLLGCTELSNRPARSLPATLPCEVTGDGNACTAEVCCEPNPGCRHLRAGTAPIGTTQIVRPDDPQCNAPSPLRAGGGPLDPTGRTRCVAIENGASQQDRVRMTCNDRQPCTIDQCANPLLGTCINVPVTTDPTRSVRRFENTVSVFGRTQRLDPGCFDTVNRGCGAQTCQFRAGRPVCATVPTASGTAGGTTHDCNGYSGSDACLANVCDGLGNCLERPDDSVCDDGISCTLDRCVPRFGICDSWDVTAGQCFIEGACLTDGTFQEGSSCNYCSADDSQLTWSLDPNCLM